MTARSPLEPAPGHHARARLPRETASVPAGIANNAWRLSLLREARAFRLAARDVAGTQAGLLMRLLDRNRKSEFGEDRGFGAMRTVEDFRTGVPLSTYGAYREDVERIARGTPGVLTSDPVTLLEPTSGSTGPGKLIPYTRSLKAEFQRAIAPWIVDLFAHNPGLLWGQSYWSISPVARRAEYGGSRIPIGFEDDSDYLGGFARRLVQTVLAVPSAVRLIEDIDSFRYVTLLFLLRSRSLSMISIWHPTFLTLLLEPLPGWLGRITDDIATGRITPPGAVSTGDVTQPVPAMPPDPARASEIERCLGAASHFGEASASLWPRLGLVSCWADGNAGSYVPTLTSLFPRAQFQPKGLVSTEGIVSIPLHGRSGAALAVRSHFFEFLPQGGGSDGGTVLAHELEPGGRYSVVMTTGGGLYRYLTHDLVDVVGHVDSVPLLRFVGKESHVSDRFGEKLNEMHVWQALDSILAGHDPPPTFTMVAFEGTPDRPAYTLFVEAGHVPDEALLSLGAQLENALRRNIHYRYCRDLGQLDALRVFRVAGRAHETYVRVCRENGQRIGDLKPSALHNTAGWSHSFAGGFLPQEW